MGRANRLTQTATREARRRVPLVRGLAARFVDWERHARNAAQRGMPFEAAWDEIGRPLAWQYRLYRTADERALLKQNWLEIYTKH